jgi:adenine-specific DNA methylase
MTQAAHKLANFPTTSLEEIVFPFERFSEVAEVESWRKEVHRPIYHLHKWWAQRLGTVFRAILAGAFSPSGTDVFSESYKPLRLNGVVFDPFMGSGTTVGEALKLGLRAIGRDINPVSYFIVRTALAPHPRAAVESEFSAIERDVAERIKAYYKTATPDGKTADVLYYFWVKVVSCPDCFENVDLFSSYVFAKNAYVRRHPETRVVCPLCGELSTVEYGTRNWECPSCHHAFDPMSGPASGAEATCKRGHRFAILKAVQKEGQPPRHRMYAKLLLSSDGAKTYARTDSDDERLYARASSELKSRPNAYPVVRLADGYNTRQVLNYRYEYWHQMFNDRQLLTLSILGERIARILDPGLRDLFATLFSGALEFNNMFASYKGEGTGAVRHMFSHHILKPERMPLEANPWGTPKSSGSFSTLFESRVLRAIEYAGNPYEVATNGFGKKVFGLSNPIGHESAVDFNQFAGEARALYLSCGDSSSTDIADKSVDAVITDPPFFDNVHYSELADFFFVWQGHVLGPSGQSQAETTRRDEEVQSKDADVFAERLGSVFRECRRVLKDDGLMAFTYHHSRPEGWQAVLKALIDAEFEVTAAQPIKSEMSVATPKVQASQPIDLDVVIVCRKREGPRHDDAQLDDIVIKAKDAGLAQVERFSAVGRALGPGDVRVILMAHALQQLSGLTASRARELLASVSGAIETVVADMSMPGRVVLPTREGDQLSYAGIEEAER